ncbi:RNA helicase [Mycena sanguinolenta]|uniref:RNA helicase n=1 Tax=Mycena sanguinolenta TaxID=230812 RepID=A0A8H7D236_9AGAR|nr:RNA helicase [Mycena sanguinolenta]
MPYLLLLVNIEISDETRFAQKFSKVAAKFLGSPETDIATNITYNRTGTAGPLAFGLTIVGLGNAPAEIKERYSASFSWFFTRKFGVPNDRVFIHFQNPGPMQPSSRGPPSFR